VAEQEERRKSDEHISSFVMTVLVVLGIIMVIVLYARYSK
jgi:hypothetical protein